MSNLESGAFLGTIHMITDNGSGPTYVIGNIDVLEEEAKAKTLKAVMLVRADDGDTWLLAKRGNLALRDVIDRLPPEMVQYGTIAGVQLEGDSKPTSIIIYSGERVEDLRQLTYARLYTSMKRTEEVQDFLKKSHDTAYLQERIKDPIPVVHLEKYSDQQESNHKQN